jgi:hypothetical protein
MDDKTDENDKLRHEVAKWTIPALSTFTTGSTSSGAGLWASFTEAVIHVWAAIGAGDLAVRFKNHISRKDPAEDAIDMSEPTPTPSTARDMKQESEWQRKLSANADAAAKPPLSRR